MVPTLNRLSTAVGNSHTQVPPVNAPLPIRQHNAVFWRGHTLPNRAAALQPQLRCAARGCTSSGGPIPDNNFPQRINLELTEDEYKFLKITIQTFLTHTCKKEQSDFFNQLPWWVFRILNQTRSQSGFAISTNADDETLKTHIKQIAPEAYKLVDPNYKTPTIAFGLTLLLEVQRTIPITFQEK